ncbi:MAG: hypothetical protein A2050_08125 [Candidatus Rokubacteria bacterium GWA2_73_35]|nr:MAG: hypothetical protein A2050_08125 [Candidatus Rokubacteria bacterium GWA2_73_35]
MSRPGGATRAARALCLAAPALAAAAVLLGLPRIAQDSAYHAFADGRTLLGVPNLLNVASNAPFVVVGALGLLALLRGRPAPVFREPWERTAFLVVFAGTALTGVGSAWYHLAPANAALVWDRLPITLVLMALLAAVVGERVGARAGRRLLPVLLATGVASVVYWYASEAAGAGDLRPYALVQFVPLVLIPLLLALCPPAYTRGGDLLVALGWYVAAKLLEQADAAVFAAGRLVSGHTLKHLAAAAGAWWLLRMVRSRRPA